MMMSTGTTHLDLHTVPHPLVEVYQLFTRLSRHLNHRHHHQSKPHKCERTFGWSADWVRTMRYSEQRRGVIGQKPPTAATTETVVVSGVG